MNTCGNRRKQRAILGQTAVMMLTWTVATSVFDALDIWATIMYDVESPAGYFSAAFSFLSVWYGLFQRKNDLAVLAQIGTKKINVKTNIADKKKQLKGAVAEQKQRLNKQWRAATAAVAGGSRSAAKRKGTQGTFAPYEFADAGGKSKMFDRVRKGMSRRRPTGGDVRGERDVEMTGVARTAEESESSAGSSNEQASPPLLQSDSARAEMSRGTTRSSAAASIVDALYQPGASDDGLSEAAVL
jgi:hypothetical protein